MFSLDNAVSYVFFEWGDQPSRILRDIPIFSFYYKCPDFSRNLKYIV